MDKEGTDVPVEERECPFWGQQAYSVMGEVAFSYLLSHWTRTGQMPLH